jgi:Flp pilus assembly protein TadD
MEETAYSLFRRGSAMLSEGMFLQAIEELNRARDLEPGKGSIREALGRALFGAGRLDAAKQEFEAAAELDPANDYAHFGLALCFERIGDLGRARGHAKMAVVMRPDVDAYQEALGRISARSEP